MENSVLSQALVLVVVGMGTVSVFLYLMVLVMRGIALVVPRFNHLLPDPVAKPAARPAASLEYDDIAVAIAAALARSRQ